MTNSQETEPVFHDGMTDEELEQMLLASIGELADVAPSIPATQTKPAAQNATGTTTGKAPNQPPSPISRDIDSSLRTSADKQPTTANNAVPNQQNKKHSPQQPAEIFGIEDYSFEEIGESEAIETLYEPTANVSQPDPKSNLDGVTASNPSRQSAQSIAHDRSKSLGDLEGVARIDGISTDDISSDDIETLYFAPPSDSAAAINVDNASINAIDNNTLSNTSPSTLSSKRTQNIDSRNQNGMVKDSTAVDSTQAIPVVMSASKPQKNSSTPEKQVNASSAQPAPSAQPIAPTVNEPQTTKANKPLKNAPRNPCVSLPVSKTAEPIADISPAISSGVNASTNLLQEVNPTQTTEKSASQISSQVNQANAATPARIAVDEQSTLLQARSSASQLPKKPLMGDSVSDGVNNSVEVATTFEGNISLPASAAGSSTTHVTSNATSAHGAGNTQVEDEMLHSVVQLSIEGIKTQLHSIAQQSDQLHDNLNALMAQMRLLQLYGMDDYSVTYEQVYQLRQCLLTTRRSYNEIPNFMDLVEAAWENDLYTAQMRRKHHSH